MATRRYKVSPGDYFQDVTEEVGAATNSDAVELTIDLANTIVNTSGGGTRSITKDEVIQALEKIKAHIIKGNWTPA
jgi:hypothetical protein